MKIFTKHTVLMILLLYGSKKRDMLFSKISLNPGVTTPGLTFSPVLGNQLSNTDNESICRFKDVMTSPLF